MRDRRAEKGDDRVAQQPRYRPTVLGDRGVEKSERAVHDLGDLLGVKPLS